ncbi:phytoene desaturase family protein [Anaerorhabdus sp.]|uniref:phytoene desaturase family protein n=1 Tax=Anaerorhabdus sp. TaxID=1872524 RepID=UPI002FCB2E8F
MKIIIIGAGLAGLSAGIYARKAGYDVEIFEKNTYAGGLCTGWVRKGSYIEGCLHWLTESKKGKLFEIWNEIGALNESVKLYDCDSFYEVHYQDKTINMYTDINKLENELYRFATDHDKKIIKKFLNSIVKVQDSTNVPAEKPFHLWSMMDGIKYAMKSMPAIKVMKSYGNISIVDFANQFESEELRFFFKNALVPDCYNVSSNVVTLAGLVSKNSGIPEGGSKPFVDRIVQRYLDLGGQLHLNCEVNSILIDNNEAKGIQCSDGTIHEGDYIVGATDVHFLLDKLLNKQFEIKDIKNADLDKQNYETISLISVIYRTNKDLSNVVSSSFYHTKEYDVLGKKFSCVGIKHYGYEPTLIHEGKTVIQINIITNEDMADQLIKMSQEEYQNFKREISKKFKDIVINECGYTDDLEELDVVTPKTYINYVNAYKGSFMSYPMTATNKQVMIMNNALPIKNIMLASQWQMMPGGTPVAVVQGKFAIQSIQNLESKK